MWDVLIPAISGGVGMLVGYISPRARSLDSQRADFQATSDLLMRQVTDLLVRVKHLEDQHVEDVARIDALEDQHVEDTKQHLRDVRRIDALTAYVKDLLAFIRTHVPSPEPPPIPPEFSNDI
ncbi:hypothetical protein IU443_29305 [Nocardia farcinica]|nr:hypothetical protein [Nocardia farcinica]AXK88630.1 hypothetical protein DXT66_26095 [Nocardia farcinica]MBF6394031.1 hypothetical protein [Nocardia farcinica]